MATSANITRFLWKVYITMQCTKIVRSFHRWTNEHSLSVSPRKLRKSFFKSNWTIDQDASYECTSRASLQPARPCRNLNRLPVKDRSWIFRTCSATCWRSVECSNESSLRRSTGNLSWYSECHNQSVGFPVPDCTVVALIQSWSMQCLSLPWPFRFAVDYLCWWWGERWP